MIARRIPIKGNGREEKPLFAGLQSPAIAHHELAASAKVVTFDVPERDFPARFNRYCPRYQGAVRALASQHPRIADLALSFPTLLFALAVPRRGLDPVCAITRAIEGARLADVAAAAELPMWRLPSGSREKWSATGGV